VPYPQRIRIASLTAMMSRMYVGRSVPGQAGPAPAGTMQAVAQEMICTSSHLYEACRELFTRYPLAVETADHGGSVASSIVLMLRDRDDAQFFLLSHQSSEGTPSYSLSPWPTGDIIRIEVDYNDAVPDVIVKAVTCGVPLPGEGSLFGWSYGNTITALVAVYTRYTPASPVPSWAMMPLVGIPDTQWPPFADERFFGRWFWEHYRAGNITLLNGLIAEVPDTVYWVDTRTILGSDCCAVVRDLMGPDGRTLSRGRYVYYQALRTGKPVPPLTELLADPSKVDLAPRFQ
jgi:hypothetical protein